MEVQHVSSLHLITKPFFFLKSDQKAGEVFENEAVLGWCVCWNLIFFEDILSGGGFLLLKRLAKTCIKDACLNHDIRDRCHFVQSETREHTFNNDVKNRNM